MQFLFFLRIRPDELPANVLTPKLIQQEITAVKTRLASGMFRSAWMRSDQIGIVALLDESNEEECRAIVGRLPFSLANILEIEKVVPVMPYHKAYP